MNDLKVLYNAEKGISIPVEKPAKLTSNKERSDEFAHTPYVDEKVALPEYPVKEEETEDDKTTGE